MTQHTREKVSRREAFENVKNEHDEVVEQKKIEIEDFILIDENLYAFTKEQYFTPWSNLKLIES